MPDVTDQDLETRLSAPAQAGEIERLMELINSELGPAEDPYEAFGLAYKWLTVASDAGHDEADEMIESVLTALHADDDNFVTGHAHFELAVSYLTGRHGLPVDFDKAHTHIDAMLSRHYPCSVQDGEGLLAEARRGMDPAAQAVFDGALAQPADTVDTAE